LTYFEQRLQATIWKQVQNIPSAALEFRADCANLRKTVVVKGASHVVMTSNPELLAAK
jgi:hypothetical protein